MKQLPSQFQVDGQPTIACDTNLRQALSTLLRTNAPTLVVVDDQTPVGLLTLDNIKASTITPPHPRPLS